MLYQRPVMHIRSLQDPIIRLSFDAPGIITFAAYTSDLRLYPSNLPPFINAKPDGMIYDNIITP